MKLNTDSRKCDNNRMHASRDEESLSCLFEQNSFLCVDNFESIPNIS